MQKKIVLLGCLLIAGTSCFLYYHFFYSLQNKYLNQEQRRMVKETPYAVQLSELEKERTELGNQYKLANRKEKSIIISKAKSIFVDHLSNRIFPYWYGTKWNFYGTTQTPQEGKIACGYFVTTTLEAAHFPLDRNSLACMASEEMIKKLTDDKHISHLSNTSIDVFLDEIKKKGKGLYIVGLDKHTGFILSDSTGIYFIHSGGQYPCHVRKDKAENSNSLINSKYKVVGKISDDDHFILKWLLS